jgi:single-strand DNA-binding protein
MNNYGQPFGNQPYGNPAGYGNQNFGNQGYGQQNVGGQNGQRNNSGFDNFSTIQLIGRLTQDPASKMVNNAKVATSKVAVNHRSEKAGTDFWFIEVWGNEGADRLHNFLVNHCPKGRRVFVTGIPELRQQKNQDGSYSYYPTIRVLDLVGLDMPKNQEGGNQQPPTGQFNQQGGYNQPPQGNFNQPPQQGGFNAPPQAGGFPSAPSQSQGGFPPNPPGGGYGMPVGAPVGAPVGVGAPNGGFPPAPPQG